VNILITGFIASQVLLWNILCHNYTKVVRKMCRDSWNFQKKQLKQFDFGFIVYYNYG